MTRPEPIDLLEKARRPQHKPFAEEPTLVLLVEPRGVRTTGTAGGERTAEPDVWI
jgi:hypothetical protein